MGMDPSQTPSEWAAGRDWRWRAPLILLLGYTAMRGLSAPMAWNVWSGITLVAHESGHAFFGWFGEVIGVAGGSIMQLLVPVIVMIALRRQGDWYGVAAGGTWLAFSLANLATYIADARAQALPLVGFSDNPEHDWHWLLARYGWLAHDAGIARVTRLCSALVLAGSVGFGLWLCRVMWRTAGSGPEEAALREPGAP